MNIKRHFPTSYLRPCENDPVEPTVCFPVPTYKIVDMGGLEKGEEGGKNRRGRTEKINKKRRENISGKKTFRREG